jgi:hypothetical protein
VKCSPMELWEGKTRKLSPPNDLCSFPSPLICWFVTWYWGVVLERVL